MFHEIRFTGHLSRALLVAAALFTAAIAQAPANDQLGPSFSAIAKKVQPAVVSIDTKGRLPEVSEKAEAPSDSDDVMDFLRRQMPRRPSYSVGSGFMVDGRGYIITNGHVISDAARITVKLDSGEEYVATVEGVDRETDLAVLKIDAGRELPFLKLGDSDAAKVGDWVLAIGSPFGLTRTVTAGIISQTGRSTPFATPFQKFIQTDAAINRGNSGGPLVNTDGEVIGINSQIATSTGDYNGVGFALPSREAAFVYSQIRETGRVRRGYLGIALDSVKAEFAKVYGLSSARGAIVTDVRDTRGPAAAAGLKAGDVIVEFEGNAVESAQDLISRVSSTAPDRSVSVVYLRENGAALERRTASMRLGERPSADRETPPVKLPLERSKADAKPFGLTLMELTPALAAEYRLEGQKGLLVKEINPESYIADVKASNGVDALGEGDLIQRLNREPVRDLKSFTTAVGSLKKGDAVVLHVIAVNGVTRMPQLKIVQFTVQ
jgi:serine protease Do